MFRQGVCKHHLHPAFQEIRAGVADLKGGSGFMRVYLDHNAGSPLRDEVRSAMIDAMSVVANPSSIYEEGRRAKGLLERARDKVANLTGAEAKAVTFTSGASEAAATVLQPVVTVKGKPVGIDRLLVAATEHDCVRKGGHFTEAQKVTLPVTKNGVINLDSLASELAAAQAAEEKCLVAVMMANNETGVIQPFEEIGQLAQEFDAFYLCDAVQAPGRLAIDINTIGAHFLLLSSHKLGGPQGAGAIVRRSDAYAFSPLIRGGGQEAYGRAGTENVVAVHGFGVAVESALEELASISKMGELRDEMEARLFGIQPVGKGATRLANTSCFVVPGVAAETLLIALDLKGFSVSSGSACSSGKVGASHVLTAMGISDELARSALRISLGWNTTKDDINRFVEAFNETVGALSPTLQNPAA